MEAAVQSCSLQHWCVLMHIFRTPFLKNTSGRLLLTCITLEKPLDSFQVTKRPYSLSFLHKGENVLIGLIFEVVNILSRCFSKKLGFLNISKYLYIKKLIMDYSVIIICGFLFIFWKSRKTFLNRCLCHKSDLLLPFNSFSSRTCYL